MVKEKIQKQLETLDKSLLEFHYYNYELVESIRESVGFDLTFRQITFRQNIDHIFYLAFKTTCYWS